MNNHYVFGNGTSRLSIDIDKLEGTKYGCNAIYRDYYTDYLIGKDKNICSEILASECWQDRKVVMQTQWRNDSLVREAYEHITWWKDIVGTNDYTDCGSVALTIASQNASDNNDKYIYMYGMDFDDPNSNKINNIYHGTRNYIGRMGQRKGVTKEFMRVFDIYTDLRYVHVHTRMPEQLADKDNVLWQMI